MEKQLLEELERQRQAELAAQKAREYFCYIQYDAEKPHQFFAVQNKRLCLEWSVLASSWLLVIEEERAKREELERILEENNRKIAEAQAKLAEEQLKIVEEQRKIHEERMKLEQERQRQQKEEQKIILGKGKSRPKLSFSLKSQD
uniref:Arginine and glutamate rich 1 n=1 Tax=Meleagris gallopavo TaxID=9103 RepID=A0A803XKR7_MELGA